MSWPTMPLPTPALTPDTGPRVHDKITAQLASVGFAPDMAAAALAAPGNNVEQAVGVLPGSN